MKRLTFTFSLAIATACSVQLQAHAQSMGGSSSGSSSGLQLNTSVNSFSNTANRTTSSSTIGLPGSFGGPGITGVARVEFSNTNVFNSFTSDGSATSTNARATGSTGSMGGTSSMGGMGMGGMGMGGMGMGGLGSRFGMGGLGGLGAMRNQSGLGARGQKTGQIRAVVRPDLDNLATERRASVGNVPVVFARLPLPDRLRGINASVESETVVLTGQVASESDKRLAETIVRLEPGVNTVRNELEIVPGARPLRSN